MVAMAKRAILKLSHTVITSVVIMSIPVVCAWAFYHDQLLGQVLSQAVLVSLCYLSRRELRAIWSDGSNTAREGYSLEYWRAMTVVWCCALSALIWVLPSQGVWIVQGVALTMMVADACALGVGVLARKVFKCRRLGEIWPSFSKWSPNKTIAGSLACLLVAWVCFGILIWLAVQAEWFAPGSATMVLTCVVFALFPVFGVAGDFYESRIKRQFGVKDSAEVLDPKRIIPWGRHGGASDRIDSNVGGVAGFVTIALVALVIVLAVAVALLYLLASLGVLAIAMSYSLYSKLRRRRK